MNLVIVETPTQAKILTDVLGDGWRVEPCVGFVRDLSIDKLGIDVDDDFRPTFAIVPGKGNLVRRLMKAIRESEAVYTATLPNRTGEAMAWHVLALSPDAKDKPIYRVTLPALTPDVIRAAFTAPRLLDIRQVEAFLTGRIIERLVSWSINARARKTVGFKTAITYDSMIALQVLAERETHTAATVSQIGWRASVALERDGAGFTAQVLNAKGAPLTLRNDEQAVQLETLLKHGAFWVDKIGQAAKTYAAPDALTLRALIEAAERDLALLPERVLTLIETLYEAGWITHPDTAPLSETSQAVQAYIRREYGTDYAVSDAIVRSGIAPTDINRIPEDLPGDSAALYALSWKHFLAAHMTPAQERVTAARILVGASQEKLYPLELRATAAFTYFDGWRRVLPVVTSDTALPILKDGDTLQLTDVSITPVTSEPPYTAVTLIGALADIGLTVHDAASAVEGLVKAEYVSEALTLTERGRSLANYLVSSFDELASPSYAADLHADIARIASGERERLDMLRTFWSRFGAALRPTPTPSSRAAGEHKPVVLRPAEGGKR